MLFQALLLAAAVASAAFAIYRIRSLSGRSPRECPREDRMKTSLWLGSILLLLGFEIVTIVLAWDFHEPMLNRTTTTLLVWGGILVAHGAFEAQRGWRKFLSEDFDPTRGALMREARLAHGGGELAGGEGVERIRYHRHLVLLSSLLVLSKF